MEETYLQYFVGVIICVHWFSDSHGFSDPHGFCVSLSRPSDLATPDDLRPEMVKQVEGELGKLGFFSIIFSSGVPCNFHIV